MITKSRRLLTALAVCALVSQACGQAGSPDTTEALRSDALVATVAPATTGATAAPDTTSEATTTTAAPRLVELVEEPPPFEAVTISTPDGLDLYAKLWRGGDTAVLFGHDYDDLTAGSAGVRQRLNRQTWCIPYTGTIANARGSRSCHPDFRGHGQSPGDLDVKGTLIDLKASYDWLQSRRILHDRDDRLGRLRHCGSRPRLGRLRRRLRRNRALVLSAARHGPRCPARSSERLTHRCCSSGATPDRALAGRRILEGSALDSRGVTVFDRVQTGLTFNDVFGSELVGLIVEFLEDVAA